MAMHVWFREHRWRPLTDLAIGVTWSGTGLIAYGLAAAAGVIFANTRRGSFRWRVVGVLAAVVTLAGVQSVRAVLSTLIARARPPRADWAFGASGNAFPSGHSTTSATVAILLLTALHATPERRHFGRWAALISVWAFAVGMTRIYLGMHWPTDVLGAWVLVAALALLATGVVRYRTVAAMARPSRAPSS